MQLRLVSWFSVPVYTSEYNGSLERIMLISETNGSLSHVTHVNGWMVPAVHMIYMVQNFR